MRPVPLGLASTAVAAASCLAVLYALREPPGSDPPGAPAADPVARIRMQAAAPATSVRSTDSAPAPPAAPDEAQRVALAARAAQADEQARRDAIFGIASDSELSLDLRLERYREAVQAAQVEATGPWVAHPGTWAEAFLRAEAVQEELAALSPAARSRELAHIRRELGYGEEEIARMHELDARREARWQSGLEYMAERERVVATFEREVQQEELRHLRERYFAHEARTIEREEDSGFFRFERPRVYGRN